MARGGHNKKSAHLHLIQGTLRADHLAGDRPTPQPIVTAPPKGLDRAARSMWRRLAPILVRAGLLTELDVSAFTVLCEDWARYEHAQHRLQRIYRLRPPADATLIRKAEVSVERSLHCFRQLAAEFGLTPAARARLDVVVPIGASSEDEEFERFLERGKPPT